VLYSFFSFPRVSRNPAAFQGLSYFVFSSGAIGDATSSAMNITYV